MILVDSNVLIDVTSRDARWAQWSVTQLDAARHNEGLCINGIVYAEVAPGFRRLEAVDAFLRDARIELQETTREMLLKAGLVHQSYRDRGGRRDRVLPDFLIGAQAAVARHAILTRDPRRYRTDFPDVRLITP